MTLRRFLIVLLVSGWTLAGLLPVDAPLATAQGATLTVALPADAATLDPSLNNARQNRNIYASIFDPLITRSGENLEMTPGLAEAWTATSDTTWELKLRRGVKFHNGDAFTAKDVQFWLERVQNEAFKSLFRSPFADITARVIDDYTVELTTKSPYPILANRLVEVYPLPSEHVKKVGDEAFAKNPVGTGAFKFVDAKKDDRTTLNANGDYWGQKPSVGSVVFRIIPEASTRVAELIAGGVDIVVGVPTDSISSVASNGRTRLATTPSGRVVFFGLDTKSGPLADKRVRQALNYAVDRRAIIDALLDGRGRPVGVLLSPYDFGFDPTIDAYPFDANRAKQLLADAGFASGIKLTMNTPRGLYLQDQEIAQAVAGMLGDIGVEITLEPLDSTAYLQKMNSTNLSPMFFGAFGSGAVMDAFQLLQYDRTGHALSYYSNPEYDDLIAQAARTVDANARADIYKKLQRISHEDAVKIFMFQYVDIYGAAANVEWTPRADELLLMNTARK